MQRVCGCRFIKALIILIQLGRFDHSFAQTDLFSDSISLDQEALDDFFSIERFFFRGSGFSLKESQVPIRVFYGSDEFGYFESKSFRIKNNRLLVDLTPPYYDKPVIFYAQDKNLTFNKLGQETFIPSYPKVLKKNIIAKSSGQPFTSPFFLISGFYLREDFSGRTYNIHKDGQKVYLEAKLAYGLIVFLNRYGEIVMAMNPHRKGHFAIGTFMTKPIKGGFASIFKRAQGRFVALGYDGKPFAESPDTPEINDILFHHDFVYNHSEQRLMTFKSELLSLRLADKKSVIDGIVEFSLKGPPNIKKIFNLADHFDLSKEKSIMENGKNSYHLGDKLPQVDYDFTHMNFIEAIDDDQILIGIRNLSKIVLFNHKTQKVVWSFGRSDADTFRNFGDMGFIHAHTPVLRNMTNLTIFDNGQSTRISRIISYDLDLKRKAFQVKWVYRPSVNFYSSERSSVAYLENGNVLILFTMPSQPGKSLFPPKDYLYEFSPDKRQEIASMEIVLEAPSHTIRSYPLNSLNQDSYLGTEWRPIGNHH